MTIFGWILTVVMFLIAMRISVGYMACGWDKWYKDADGSDWFFGIAVSSLSIMLAILLLFGLSHINKTELPPEITETKLFALTDSTTSESHYTRSLFVGRGYSEETLTYYYRHEYKRGKKIGKVKVDDAYITESESMTPMIVEYRYNEELNLIGRVLFKEPITHDYTEYEFIVPLGTIYDYYESDMADGQ